MAALPRVCTGARAEVPRLVLRTVGPPGSLHGTSRDSGGALAGAAVTCSPGCAAHLGLPVGTGYWLERGWGVLHMACRVWASHSMAAAPKGQRPKQPRWALLGSYDIASEVSALAEFCWSKTSLREGCTRAESWVECLAGTSLENSDTCLTCGAPSCAPGAGDISSCCFLPRWSPRSSPAASCLCAPLQAHRGDRTHPQNPCPLLGSTVHRRPLPA